jgi:tetratricopeptide (TPR) repeat protein
LPQILSIAFLILVFRLVIPDGDWSSIFIVGATIYVVYSFGSRYLILTAHRQGLKAMARKDYDRAIERFEKSYEFFAAYPWIDKYRAVTMMSPSLWTYREMALMNIASVYIARNDITAAESACVKVLDEFPENEVVADTLKLIRSAPGANEA